MRLLEDENPKIREAAIKALGALRAEESVSKLLEILEKEECDIRYDAIEALKEIGSITALDKLQELQKIMDDNFVYAIASIQSRCQFYNYEIYQQSQEAESLKSEDDDFITNFYKDLDEAVYTIQENPELRQNDSEDRTTMDIVNLLRSSGYNASHDSKVGGHVDLVVRKDSFLWLGEAKIYRGANYLWEGFQQLATRYSIGESNQNNGGLLIYIREEDASSIMEKWRNYLFEKSLPDYTCKPCKTRSLAFVSTHRHEKSGQPFHVRHIPVMLHFAPKDKSGRSRKESS